MRKSLPGSNRRWRLSILAAALALALTLLLAVISYAGRHADWAATEFQLQNLDSVPAEFTAHFYDPDGSEVFVFTGAIPPGRNAFYQPEQMGLDPAFVGTLRVETDQQIAGAVMHVATTTIPGFNGNDVFEMFPDDTTHTTYFAPYIERSLSPDGLCSLILISNLGSVGATVDIHILNPDGTLALAHQITILVDGSGTVNLAAMTALPPGFTIGSAVITAEQPIQVDIVGVSEAQWAIYAAPFYSSTLLYAPRVQGYQPGVVAPTISLQNVSATTAQVTICPAEGPCSNYELAPGASQKVALLSPEPGSYVISSTQPIAAVVGAEGTKGGSAYAAVGLDQTTTRLAAPMLFDNYLGWETTLWVYNTSAVTTTATVTYTGAFTTMVAPPPPTVTVVYTSARIPPHSAMAFEPTLGTPHYAALVAADQPILGLIEGNAQDDDDRFIYRYDDDDVEDSSFTYWATAYTPRPVTWIYLPMVVR